MNQSTTQIRQTLTSKALRGELHKRQYSAMAAAQVGALLALPFVPKLILIPVIGGGIAYLGATGAHDYLVDGKPLSEVMNNTKNTLLNILLMPAVVAYKYTSVLKEEMKAPK
jgi:hypothetical protein